MMSLRAKHAHARCAVLEPGTGEDQADPSAKEEIEADMHCQPRTVLQARQKLLAIDKEEQRVWKVIDETVST